MRTILKTLWLTATAALAAAAFTIPSCAQAFQHPPEPQQLSETSPEVTRGYQIYISHCAACHHARQPDLYSAQRWDTILPEMARRAKLSEEDTAAVSAYIDAARAK